MKSAARLEEVGDFVKTWSLKLAAAAAIAGMLVLAGCKVDQTKEVAQYRTLLDASSELPLFRYLREASDEASSLRFARMVRLGTLDAIRARALAGAGVAVLPLYFIAADLARKRLRRLLPGLPVGSDLFRLLFRRDDPRRSVYERLAAQLRAVPLR